MRLTQRKVIWVNLFGCRSRICSRIPRSIVSIAHVTIAQFERKLIDCCYLHTLHVYDFALCVYSADSMMIFSPDIIKRIILPHDIEIILSDLGPCSLFEYTLRTLYRNRGLCEDLAIDCLPQKFIKCLQRGPISMCDYDQCGLPIFTECHFSLLRK